MDMELPELPESEKEIRKDKLNTLVAVTVTVLVTFMALCKINDNNTVLAMQQVQASKVDNWSWYQALNVREDINQSKLSDLKSNLQDEENGARRKGTEAKIAEYEALAQKIAGKKEQVKTEAEASQKRYESYDATHEKFDRSEAFISIAISLLALTALLQKRWMFAVALLPATFGVIKGILGLLS